MPTAGADVTPTATPGTGSAADPLVPGQPAALTLLVSNPGALAAGGALTIQDALPSGLVFSGALNDGWLCSSDDGLLVTCASQGPLAGGSQTRLQLLVDATPDATGLVTNTASVTNPALDPDAALPTTIDTLPVVDPTSEAEQR